MIVELTLDSRFSDYVTVRSTLVRGRVFVLLEKLKRYNSYEISEEIFKFLERDDFYDFRNGKIVKIPNINSKLEIRKLKEFNDKRKEEHEKMKEFENTLLYSNSSNIKLNDYNNR